MLSPTPKKRYMHSAICNICLSMIDGKLFNEDDDFIKTFLERDGNFWVCPVCQATVVPDANRCPACGRMIALEEWTFYFG